MKKTSKYESNNDLPTPIKLSGYFPETLISLQKHDIKAIVALVNSTCWSPRKWHHIDDASCLYIGCTERADIHVGNGRVRN